MCEIVVGGDVAGSPLSALGASDTVCQDRGECVVGVFERVGCVGCGFVFFCFE